MRIILATPDDAQRERLHALIAALGHHVTDTFDSTDLVKRCLRDDADVVVVDLALGPLRGVELIALLRELDTDLLLVPIVSANDADTEFAVRGLGIFYYMLEPIDPQELRDVLHSARRSVGALDDHAA